MSWLEFGEGSEGEKKNGLHVISGPGGYAVIWAVPVGGGSETSD